MRCACCGQPAGRLVPTYWSDDQLCPDCCEKVAAACDERGSWPPVPDLPERGAVTRTRSPNG
jgi:hypothetical protein